MKIKRMVKRLLAVGTGVTMLGATAMGALAADLSNYPDMFVSDDGVFDGLIVVGRDAGAEDTFAAVDIVANMKYSTGSGTSTTTVSGDAWLVGTSSKKLELANTNGTAVGEQLYDIETFIGKDELAALGDGTFTTTGSSSTYSQYLYFDVRGGTAATNAESEIVQYVENDNDIIADFFFVKSGRNLGEYVLEFSSSPESTIQDTAGATSTSGTVLDDYENTQLMMMGMTYDIVLARRPQSTPEDSIKLTLMGGSSSGSLQELESTTLAVGDKSFDVALVYVDTTYAKFTVNGQQTDKLQKGDTFKLSDDTEIGVSEILYQSYAGGVHSADFFVGASKLELRDNDVTDSTTSNTLKVGTESISGADVIIEGSDDNTTFTMTKIRVNMTAQDDYFVGADEKLSDAIVEQGDDKELVFTNNWDIEYKGLTSEDSHELKLHSSTDRKYKLRWYDGDNNMVDMPFMYATSSVKVQMSEDSTDKAVLLNEGLNVSKNDYFVLTSGTASAGTGKSYAFQYKGADKSTATSPKIKFKNLGSGETVEYSVDTGTSSTVATIKVGGNSFIVKNATNSSKTASDFVLNIDMNGDGTLADDQPVSSELDIIDYYGVSLDFEGTLYRNDEDSQELGAIEQPVADAMDIAAHNGTGEGVNITVETENSNDYDNVAPPIIQIHANATATNELTIASFSSGQVGGALTDSSLTPEGEENVGYGYTSQGAKWTYETPSSSPNQFTYDYPRNQRLPQVYVTSGATSSTSRTGGNKEKVSFVDATKFDDEVTVDAQNLIVIGGPCANKVAASLLGNTADCTAGFRAGVGRIKLFEHSNGNVAMLVAGFTGADTRLAGKVIDHRWAELTGDELEVEGASYGDAAINVPTVVSAAPATPTVKS